MTDAQKSGKSLAALPPPKPSAPDPSLVPCPHCGRRFNETAGERHMQHCKNIKAKVKLSSWFCVLRSLRRLHIGDAEFVGTFPPPPMFVGILLSCMYLGVVVFFFRTVVFLLFVLLQERRVKGERTVHACLAGGGVRRIPDFDFHVSRNLDFYNLFYVRRDVY